MEYVYIARYSILVSGSNHGQTAVIHISLLLYIHIKNKKREHDQLEISPCVHVFILSHQS